MAATRFLSGGAIIDGVAMTANITSDTLDVQGAGVVGLHFVSASATHVGSFTVELSVDGTNWDATGFRVSAGTSATSVAAASGSAVAELVQVDVLAARLLRVVYTFTSGTGTAYVYAIRKRLSATSTNGTATVTGTVTANAGTNLNTSALALETTQTAMSAKLPASLGSKADAASMSVTQSTEDKAVQSTIAGDTTSLDAKTPDIAGQTFDATALVDQLALTTSADESAQLSAGVYRICSTADCYILQADSDAGTDLATYADGHFLPAGIPEFIAVTGATNDYLAALVVAGTGVLTISGPF